MFHYTVETSKSVQVAVQDVQEELQKEKFGVLWDFDVQDTLQQKGYEFTDSYRILEVCNPGEAKRVLEQQPLVSYFLPCKVVVYEEDGVTKIGMPKPTALFNLLEDEAIQAIGRDIEERMTSCLNKAC
ncbi:DUF302 domain-containing protein [Pontibacillus salicampi]|uniref:DUF302 domain-containing protein n=1 Tax=Pontibacillus salicampi TaxID=1449801 RepID=A0ABV6LN56_9BACI